MAVKKSRTNLVSTAPSDLAVHSWLAVVRAYNLCVGLLSQRLADLDLHVGEHEVLVNLLRAPGITQQELAQRCFVAKSGVSMLLSRMERAKLVKRQADATDARAKRLSLTAKGERLAIAAQKIQTEIVLAMASQSSDHDLTIIADAMQRTSAVLETLRKSG